MGTAKENSSTQQTTNDQLSKKNPKSQNAFEEVKSMSLCLRPQKIINFEKLK